MQLLFNKYKPFISYKPTPEHYVRAIKRTDKSEYKKLAYLYIMLGAKIKPDFKYFVDIEPLLGLLTPADILQMFPVTKVYNGGDDFKDYYSVTEALPTRSNSQLGCNVYDYLMEYLNIDINMFMVNFMSAISNKHKEEYGTDILEEFFGDLTKYTIPYDTMNNYNIIEI